MIKKIIIGFLCISCFFACEMLLKTPFPDELTGFSAHVNLKDKIPDPYTSDYRIKIIKHILCISVTGSETTPHTYFINTETMTFIPGTDNALNSLFMLEAGSGNIIAGNQKYTPAMEPISLFTTIESHQYGFAFGSYNYAVFRDSGNLRINVYNADWIPDTINNSITSLNTADIDELENVFFSYSDVNLANPVLRLQFSNNNGRKKMSNIPLTALNGVPLKLTSSYFTDNEPEPLPYSESEQYYFTDSGYCIKGDGEYHHYAYSDHEMKTLSHDYNESDLLLAFDQEGKYYYRFNKTTKTLNKYQVWW